MHSEVYSKRMHQKHNRLQNFWKQLEKQTRLLAYSSLNTLKLFYFENVIQNVYVQSNIEIAGGI